MTPEELAAAWRRRAHELRPFSESAAVAFTRAADELEAVLSTATTALVNLSEASRLSGFSPDHLGRLVRVGRLRNYGSANRPRLRVGDLPRKAMLTASRARGILKAQ